MQPKDNSFEESHGDLFRSRLEQIVDRTHALCVLANKIDWKRFDCFFGALFAQKKGRPALPTRLVVGLHYLKHTFNESDESVVAGLLENPYWQYFCGFKYFQHELPIDPSSMTRWRKRLGSEKLEELLTVTIHTAKEEKLLTEKHLERVNVDTTVQEKAIAFPTDARLYHKARRVLVKIAKKMKIDLRQSYERNGKKAFLKQGRYASAGQYNRAKKETKKLKTMLGRVIRDIERKCSEPIGHLVKALNLSKAIFNQKKDDKNKVYSVHAPEVECIAKGKVHKKYEFGCKVSMVSSSKGNWILAIDALHGNPLAMQQNTSTYFYHADGLGSIVALTNTSGTPVQRYSYDSFGNITPAGSITQPFTYTGREYDSETSMYFYRARFFDPKAGRFITKDPIGFAGGDVNLYAYALNNPVNYIDPWGLYRFGPGAKGPLTPGLDSSLKCFEKCAGADVTVTSGVRKGNKGPHGYGNACDLGRNANPDLDRPTTESCYASCFNQKQSYGQEEDNNPDIGGTHFHIQSQPGRGGARGFALGIKPYQP